MIPKGMPDICAEFSKHNISSKTHNVMLIVTIESHGSSELTVWLLCPKDDVWEEKNAKHGTNKKYIYTNLGIYSGICTN